MGFIEFPRPLCHFYEVPVEVEKIVEVVCQCPISGSCHFYTNIHVTIKETKRFVSMPYIGLMSFLPCRSGSLDFSGFWGSFLQVIHRIF